MDPVPVAAAFAGLLIVYRVYHRYTRISLADVPGPESTSFMMGASIPFSSWLSSLLLMWPSGNMKEVYQGEAAEVDFRWQAQYGDVVRFKGPFSVCHDTHTRGVQLLISLFIGRSIDDFRPRRLAVHVCKVRLSVSQTGISPHHLYHGQRKRNSMGGR